MAVIVAVAGAAATAHPTKGLLLVVIIGVEV